MQTLRVQSHEYFERLLRRMAAYHLAIRDALEGGVVAIPAVEVHAAVYHCSVLEAILFYKHNTDECLCRGVALADQVLKRRIPASTRSQERYDQRVLCLQALGEMWLRWFEVINALAKHPPTLFLWMTPSPEFLAQQMRRSIEELKRLRAWRAFGRMRPDVAEYINAWIVYADGYLAADA